MIFTVKTAKVPAKIRVLCGQFLLRDLFLYLQKKYILNSKMDIETYFYKNDHVARR